MEPQDRQAIEGLFNRLGEAERNSPPKDAEAEALIREQVSRQPGAPYLMAQTIVMQDYALNEAQRRIEELERQAAERPAETGGFLSGLFGGGSKQPERPAPQPSSMAQRNGPMGAPAPGAMGAPASGAMGAPSGPWRGVAAQQAGAPGQPARGGFLAGAAQTAMGVAGGVLIANAVGSMFGGGEAKAAEAAPAAAEPAASETPAAEPAADDSGGLGSFFGGDEDGDFI